MTRKEYEWDVNMVKERRHVLNLTFEQAEKIYDYEKEMHIYPEGHSFSVWEEWDYEQTIFRQILDEEQFKIYLEILQQQIKRYEENLVEIDTNRTSEVAYYEELLDFYETRFLPDFFKDPFTLYFGFLPTEQAKVDYLKSEYRRFLGETKKRIVIEHFRYNRTFTPIELKVALLRHRLGYLLPDYYSFRYQMDEPTKAMAGYLCKKLKYMPEKTEALFKMKMEELKVFSEKIVKKYYGERDGWHVMLAQSTDEEKKESDLMTLLLLEKEKYAVIPPVN